MNKRRFVDDLQGTITQRIKAARATEKLSQADVAKKLGEYGLKIGPSAYAKLERGERRIEFAEALVLSQVLHVSFADLIPAVARPEDEMRRMMSQLAVNAQGAEETLSSALAAMNVVHDSMEGLRQLAKQAEDDGPETMTISYAKRLSLPILETQLIMDMKNIRGAARRLDSLRQTQFFFEADLHGATNEAPPLHTSPYAHGNSTDGDD